MPYYPYSDSAAGHRHNYIVGSWFRRLVAEYTGLNFLQIGELDYIQYLIWRRDAFIYRADPEYLDNAWRMEQTKPDRAGLRRIAGKERSIDGRQEN